MNLANLPIGKPALRACDTNTLWRLFDEAKAARARRITLLEHRRAETARDQIATVLRTRGVRVGSSSPAANFGGHVGTI